jgi:ribonuclease HI
MISSNTRVLQVNLNRSLVATESALQVAIDLKIDILFIQEPWIIQSDSSDDYSTARSVSHPSFTQILPVHSKLRPRTLVYVSKDYKPVVSIASNSPTNPDVLIVDISESGDKIQAINIYNEKDLGLEGGYTLDRFLYNFPIAPKSLLLGDFNSHHPMWEPTSLSTTPSSEKLVDWIEDHELALLNTPGVGTYFRSDLDHPSVLDLAFSTSSIASRTEDWQVLPDLGSDHLGILFTITGDDRELVENPTHQARFNTKLANWELFTSTLQQLVDSHSLDQIQDPTTDNLESASTALTESITKAAKASIPILRPGARSKPWWTPELKDLRKVMMRNQRLLVRDIESKQRYLQSKNQYFLAIKQAKREHWNTFLEKEDTATIFKAMSYTRDQRVEKIPPITSSSGLVDSFQEKADTFRKTLFPQPPQSVDISRDNYTASDKWDWPTLSIVELANACSSVSVKGKTPGPDQITQAIITKAYEAIPDFFYKLYASLLDTGYHPRCWKQATGAILKKPGKPDNSAPKAYRVISLLNCLGKVSERLLAQRLSYLAETTNLLHPSQIGGRLSKSAIDAALLLSNEVEQNKRLNRRSTSLFLDVKGAFDHVSKNQLLATLRKLQLPTNLIAWVSSFLQDRQLRLSFDGQTEEFSSIETGIPQGSPVSPILFLIYIRDLFDSSGNVTFRSYMDDISITTATTSLKKNVQILEREARRIYQLAEKNCIQFDLSKTELLHWTTEKVAKTTELKLPNGDIVKSQGVVKWLGIWFDANRTFKQHVATRVAQATATFHRLARLANSERGLSAYALRQLYLACVTSVADYGSVIWWKGQQNLKKPLQSLQNLGLRKILGVFRTAPIPPMEVEAGLAPTSIRLDNNIRRYALRTKRLASNHPVQVAIRAYTSDFLLGVDQTPLPARASKKTQLERITSSIPQYTNPTEVIHHHYFPPWNRQIPFKVQLSQFPKEEAAKIHNETIKQFYGTGNIAIYTDASDTETGKGIGVGLVAYEYQVSGGKRTIRQTCRNIGRNQQVYNGELEGVTSAIELASSIANPGQQYYIYSDNKAGLIRLQKASDQPGQSYQIRAIKAANQLTEKGATLTIAWVPGHTKTQVEGNERADKLAKLGTKRLPNSDITSFSTMAMDIRKTTLESWSNFFTAYTSKISHNSQSYGRKYIWKPPSLSVPKGAKREQISSFYQLKLGHGYLKSYLHRLGLASNDTCSCGGRETPEHLLLSCGTTSIERRGLKAELGGLELSLPLLLHTKSGTEKTLAFLKKTGIVTRKWHLIRREEDGNEEVNDVEGEEGG